ncbi:zf-HC2 domain-containing protein [Pseudonocardia acidicola]|uniref:Putative zinc-finger domain-containing protein n=1 Tax=Pseudonocardia acidicola TaxID=2724939 RepID=A0ABX1SG14_9PSEU|nr:zf-HC2 domain-containing protein [Pseudonocardia acidicola]NMH99423.1 hypothetical protein [Pseudonocardia acidicola]
MTDETRGAVNRLSCEQSRQIAAEFALGVLPGFERAQVLEHLDGCAGCRWTVARLTATRDRLLEMLPEAEPPAGFERMVLDGLRRPLRRSPRWLPLAAALLGVVLLAGGWLLGRAGAPPAVTAPDGALAAAQLTVDGRRVGQAFAYPGQPSFVYVSLDTQLADQTGPVSCTLERPDGSSVPIGTFTVRRGYGHWGASAQLQGDALRSARLVLVDASGATVAAARFSG